MEIWAYPHYGVNMSVSTYKASIFNYIFNSVNAIVVIINGIVMVPIYFRFMSVSTYGAWLATGNLVAMIGLLESGFASVITQKMSSAIAQADTSKFQLLAGANILTALMISSAMLLIGLAIAPFITHLINIESNIQDDILVAYIVSLVSSCIALLVSLFGAFPQVWQDTKSVGMISTIANIAAILSLVGYLFAGLGVVSIALSYLTRAVLNLILQGLWIITKWKRDSIPLPIFCLSETKLLFKDCIYPFLSRLSGVIMNNSQSLIISSFMNPALAAIYDLTAKICYVACSFVSMTNGSFFALFSLTLASNDQTKINNVFRTTSRFFIISLGLLATFSICFTEPIMYYWVGLDKFGGKLLLLLIVIAKVTFQLRSYCNNTLYSGGKINKSAKLDMICMGAYLIILFAIIKYTQEYAIPLATLLSSLIFIGLYMKIIKRELRIDTTYILKILIKNVIITSIFVIINHFLHIDYTKISTYIIYFIMFCMAYFIVLYFTNKSFIQQLLFSLKRRQHEN